MGPPGPALGHLVPQRATQGACTRPQVQKKNNKIHLAVQGPPGDLRVHQGATQFNDCGKFKAPHLEASCNNREYVLSEMYAQHVRQGCCITCLAGMLHYMF